ncbi:MAG: TRAP transporter small permease subunit [Thermodesulfobacteriota bacterium]|nr:TRAP transporter small permease subunit [Thermodesulfobacteriota bacterium]
MKTIEKFITKTVDISGKVVAFLLLLMVLNVSYDVMMRYLFHNSSVGMQEMEWHLFAVVFLFGIGIALKDEGHVRVDFLYDRFSPRKKALVNIIGTLLFLMPFALLIFSGSLEFVKDAYITREISEDPGGLPFRWLIKGMIPFSFAFLFFSAVGYILQNVRLYREASE